jgi:hypothetical protein
MFPQFIIEFFTANQELLWLTTLFVDLGCTLVLYRLFGKVGLQIAIAVSVCKRALASFSIRVFFSRRMC